ncbi:MAG: hypothetical protein OXU75_21350 [Deltaproteobacteria bacterium]|nr:hypothetical protein [Deltaproteobacteria bacterium]
MSRGASKRFAPSRRPRTARSGSRATFRTKLSEHVRIGKAFRKRDVWELHLLHRLLDMAGLLEGRAGLCQLTALGREMLGQGRRGALQAILFRHVF